MTNKILFILLTVVLTGSLQGCKKDKTENTSTTNNTGGSSSAAFTCKIDGTTFTADSARVNSYAGGFSIMAFKSGETAFELNLKDPAVGNHSFARGSNEAATYITASAYFVNQSGELVVAAYDATAHTISGTFHFAGANGNDTKTFTEGAFDIK